MVSVSFLLVICCPLSSGSRVIVVVFHRPRRSLGACCSYQSLTLIDRADRELSIRERFLSEYVYRT